MFEKWTKKFTEKATDNAVESVKKTLNDRIDEYGDIIKIGLVLSVIILGGRHITKKTSRSNQLNPYTLSQNGYPVVINNYYTREREDYYRYERRREEEKRQPRNHYQKREDRR